jgi:anti-sigma B factor antagonist
MDLEVETAYEDGIAVCRCTGRLTHGSAFDRFTEQIDACLRAGFTKLVLEMSGVRYIDAAGVGGLVKAVCLAKNSGGNLVLVGLQKKIVDLLGITRFYDVFRVFNEMGEATKYLKTLEASPNAQEAKT